MSCVTIFIMSLSCNVPPIWILLVLLYSGAFPRRGERPWPAKGLEEAKGFSILLVGLHQRARLMPSPAPMLGPAVTHDDKPIWQRQNHP